MTDTPLTPQTLRQWADDLSTAQLGGLRPEWPALGPYVVATRYRQAADALEAHERFVEARAFVIERHINSELHYWMGHGVKHFDPRVAEALRFARREDADRVLGWMLDGHGRVAEHLWVGAPPLPADPPVPDPDDPFVDEQGHLRESVLRLCPHAASRHIQAVEQQLAEAHAARDRQVELRHRESKQYNELSEHAEALRSEIAALKEHAESLRQQNRDLTREIANLEAAREQIAQLPAIAPRLSSPLPIAVAEALTSRDQAIDQLWAERDASIPVEVCAECGQRTKILIDGGQAASCVTCEHTAAAQAFERAEALQQRAEIAEARIAKLSQAIWPASDVVGVAGDDLVALAIAHRTDSEAIDAEQAGDPDRLDAAVAMVAGRMRQRITELEAAQQTLGHDLDQAMDAARTLTAERDTLQQRIGVLDDQLLTAEASLDALAVEATTACRAQQARITELEAALAHMTRETPPEQPKRELCADCEAAACLESRECQYR